MLAYKITLHKQVIISWYLELPERVTKKQFFVFRSWYLTSSWVILIKWVSWRPATITFTIEEVRKKMAATGKNDRVYLSYEIHIWVLDGLL